MTRVVVTKRLKCLRVSRTWTSSNETAATLKPDYSALRFPGHLKEGHWGCPFSRQNNICFLCLDLYLITKYWRGWQAANHRPLLVLICFVWHYFSIPFVLSILLFGWLIEDCKSSLLRSLFFFEWGREWVDSKKITCFFLAQVFSPFLPIDINEKQIRNKIIKNDTI